MGFQVIILAAFVAVANAGFIGSPLGYAAAPESLAYAAPVGKAVVAKTVDADFDPHPQYSYAYDVQDSITGDFKNQHETRDGDLVQGSYSLLEADGSKRTVDYTADDQNGFNAVVRKEAVAKVATPVVAAAPAKIAYPQTISFAQPAQLNYAQPAHYSYAQPAQYSYAQPAQYSYAQPAQYSYAQPAQYNYAKPAQYSYAKPAQYSYAQPSQYSYAQPAEYGYAQQVSKISPAALQITYAQPIAKYAPKLSYGQPIAKYEPALTYGAPISKISAAPAHSVLAASKYAGPLSYIAHVAYSSPYFSYSH